MYSDIDLLNQIQTTRFRRVRTIIRSLRKTLFLLFRRTQVEDALIHAAMTQLFRTVWEQPTRYPNFQGFILHTLRQLSSKENIFRFVERISYTLSTQVE